MIERKIDFFTSDWHLFHENIIKYCNRPFASIEEMHNVLISKYNQLVLNDSVVVFLGDISLVKSKYTKPIIDKLNGYKILLRGNHDRSIKQMLESGFDEVYTGCKEWNYSNKTIRLSHYPEDLNSNDDWLISGHVHEKYIVQDKIINVSVDVWDFYPVAINEINKIIGVV